jgi:hypothetical protein
MNLTKFRIFAMNIIDKLPKELQNIVFKTVTEVRFIIFRIKLTHVTYKDTPNPARVYWISPQRIMYHTNYIKNKDKETIHFADRVFEKKMRGKVVAGNWDITNYKFTDLPIYEAFKRRIKEGVEWQDTKFYKGVFKAVESGRFVWGIKNKDDLDNHCKYLDSLYESIKNEGYRLNRNICDKNSSYDEIDVNIGRNGEYLFQNGVHRLSIAKILGIKNVPSNQLFGGNPAVFIKNLEK